MVNKRLSKCSSTCSLRWRHEIFEGLLIIVVQLVHLTNLPLFSLVYIIFFLSSSSSSSSKCSVLTFWYEATLCVVWKVLALFFHFTSLLTRTQRNLSIFYLNCFLFFLLFSMQTFWFLSRTTSSEKGEEASEPYQLMVCTLVSSAAT